ncbi:glycosyl hydrolase family 18 protein [Micromonospora sp. M12]
MTVAAAVAFVPSSMAAVSSANAVPMVACTAPAWAEGTTYQAGGQVTYGSRLYQALVTHTAHPGAGWNPPRPRRCGVTWARAREALRRPPHHRRRPRHPPRRPRPHLPTTPPPTGGTCAVKSRPTGKVLQGYWENWDGASNGVHPGLGWIPITDSRLNQHGYNVINAAFPVIRADGTVLWENGMDAGVKVATPAEMCQAKAAGATILMSIGGAAAGIDLSSSAVADRFIATIVPILTAYHFDGIDIDIETGLTGSGNINTLSTSQANLIRIIDGVLARMPSNFGLTMAPETAYVTGGSVVYGSIWGSYLPIIKKYVDNGRLWWLNMQYYNGSMYGCAGDSYRRAPCRASRCRRSASTTASPSRAPPSACRTTSRFPACRRRSGRAAAICRRPWSRRPGTPCPASRA